MCDVDGPVQDLEVVEDGVDEEEPGVMQGHTNPAGCHNLGATQGTTTISSKHIATVQP
jgi:hypothetical protein